MALFFVGLGALSLLAVILAAWQSLRAAFGIAGLGTLRATVGSLERTVLLDEKNALLRSIKDLRFERDLGKIAEPDFERLDASLRARARDVLRLLDADVQPFKAAAERLLREQLQRASSEAPYRDQATDLEAKRCPSCDTLNAEDADWCKACAARIAQRLCPSCEALNDPDAVFCKKCAHRLGEDTPDVPGADGHPDEEAGDPLGTEAQDEVGDPGEADPEEGGGA